MTKPLLPFESRDFIATRATEKYALAALLTAMASNDPKRVAGAADEFQCAALQVADLLNVVEESMRLRESDSAIAGLAASDDNIAGAIGLASALTHILANASVVLFDAVARAGEGKGE